MTLTWVCRAWKFMCESSYFNRWKFSDSPERWSIKYTINFSKGLHSIIVLYYWHPRWELTASCCNSAFLCSAAQSTPALLHHCAAFHHVQLLVSPDSAFPSCSMQCFSGFCPGSQESGKQHQSPHSPLNSQLWQHHELICSQAWLSGNRNLRQDSTVSLSRGEGAAARGAPCSCCE